MGKGIRLSQKYGLNAGMIVCFWCGESIGVAVHGHVAGDKNMCYSKVIADYEPCDKCKEIRAKGVTAIETTTVEIIGLPPFRQDQNGHDVWPTGFWVVISDDGIKKMLREGKLRDSVLKSRVMMIDSEIAQKLQAMAAQPEEGEQP